MMERGIPHFREGKAQLPFTERQAIEDLREPFADKDLEKWTEKVAHVLCVTGHKTWGHALEGLNQMCMNNFEFFDQRLNALGMSVGDRTEIKRMADNYMKLKNRKPPSSAKVIVKCSDVSLKLTMTPKFMAKPMTDAILKPFLKAYSTKAGLVHGDLGTPATVDDVHKVEIVHDRAFVDDEKDKEVVKDITAPLNKILYEEEVKLRVTLTSMVDDDDGADPEENIWADPKKSPFAHLLEKKPDDEKKDDEKKDVVDLSDAAPPEPSSEPVFLQAKDAADAWKEKI